MTFFRLWWREYVAALVGYTWTCHLCGYRLGALSEKGHARQIRRHRRSCVADPPTGEAAKE